MCPFSGNQRPDLLTSLMDMSLVLRLPCDMHLSRSSANAPSVLGNVLRATAACTFSTSQLPKVVRAWCVLYILTWQCASRYNGVRFFNISTSESGASLVYFGHFDLQMCFAPRGRALFRHLNFQKWSEHGVFCTF